ncbi:hypothetical protein J14TS5_40900 [Paenibacillus lautus]|uniref:DUF3888 domain-containing protein n=1 Tax=Paenibacillus lautus TaxID=1401 RepID=UPI001B07C955|nr:DUF3888 domain-containing protein [Paenibacillus lautus]GIO99004.1 hypothetical protein J14TS5_40900 [Paenibacillus lautus]
MHKRFISLILAVVTVIGLQLPSYAEGAYSSPKKDSAQLQYQDMLMLFLLPHIDKAVRGHYIHTLKEQPLVYPYFVDVTGVKRVNGFRGFHFIITLEASPTVGPHITVGKDRLVFEVAPTIPGGMVKLVEYKHLETYELPPHWQDIVK